MSRTCHADQDPYTESDVDGPSRPFQFHLPENVPSSFEGTRGHVRYWVECVVTGEPTFEENAKKMFVVDSVLDLNKVPAAKVGLCSFT